MRIRFQFTVRTLAFLVTLLCVYLGAWEATKTWGVPPAKYAYTLSTIHHPVTVWAESPVPFVVRAHVVQGEIQWTEHYLWFFGIENTLALHDMRQ